ncbi:hypothetical protein RB195_001415 [Necator americanus]
MTIKDDEEVEHFRTVVCEQLRGELMKGERNRQEILKELQEYASLLVVVQNMQRNKDDKISIRTSLGHQLFVNAEVDKRDTVIVKLAADLFAELKLNRAEIFITQKLEILRKKAELCLQLISRIKATMKFLMAATGEYEKLTAKNK